ncbi:IclR family transcriptional regulator [Brevibacterium moorei]|uniref:IclR family transcriptional regulator n=1 Tax=Brevibacterium moorei TaxID=2968457 RepID=UPI00211C6658|nr:helix-turn-helix domain-containing protein [Brevibacterium sp. 68QC2CO]MCQ9385767.1 helix-turn-helix domain-containing protein [Brevibacterium sp. 68QC2CO]
MNERTHAGTQTLARGLNVLRAVAAARTGMTVQEVSESAGIHRTIASRILQTLSDYRLVARGSDGRYRGASGLVGLASGAYAALRQVSLPVIRQVADELESTMSLLVVEHDEAVALAVVTSAKARYRLVFAEGSRHPLDRGAAGVALSALAPAAPGEREVVTRAREQGWVQTFAEVEPGAYGVAVPLHGVDSHLRACLNLITYREDVAESAVPAMLRAAERIAQLTALE